MHQFLHHILKKLTICLFFVPSMLYGQHTMSLPEYIETYKDIAITEMRASGIPASIKMAQAILESGFGNSELALNANNHFGIKCHGWPGKTYTYTDDEPDECFRRYDDPVESFYDHTAFLTLRPRYASLFKLDILDYEAWAYGLSSAGYATNPNYPAKLIRVIREHKLHNLDHLALDDRYLASDTRRKSHMRKISAGPVNNKEDLPAVRTFGRQEGTYNRIRFVVAREGDTPLSLERELDMRAWQIRRYNDLENDNDIRPGQRIYLQPKRRKGGADHHIAKAGDTMESISQEYGIRIENLYRRNDMREGEEPKHRQKILLRGYKGSALQYLFRRP
jgi:hypothetical protein